ncbi:olfactory receptor 7A40-like [Rhinophrynus dorsalis]
MLTDLISKNKSISVRGCIIQCFIFVLGIIENYLLALMAYDRYLAICNPLRYPVLMNSRLCQKFDKIVSVFYLVLTPLLNPIIYTMRNKDVRNALRAYVKRNT